MNEEMITTEVTEVANEKGVNPAVGGALLVGVGGLIGAGAVKLWDKFVSPKIQQKKAAKLNAAQDATEQK